jgi:phospholipid/cholesterol/gamma-HCH transport system permease protein
MLPILVVIADVVAVLAGWIGVKAVLPITDWDFRYGALYFWRPFDAYYSMIKAVAFGFAIGLISCYMGFNTQQGAEGVGKSTTAAVVTSSVTILLLNMLLARMLLHT